MSAGLTWSMISPSIKPLVKADIQFWHGPDQNLSFISSSTFSDSNLHVRLNSILILTCIASYPITWFKDDDKYRQDIEYYHSSIYGNSSSSRPAVKPFESRLKFDNVTVNTGGLYRCCGDRSLDVKFPETAINITLDLVESTPLVPDVLQTGFIDVGVLKQTTVVLSIVYSVPTGFGKVLQYFELPNGYRIHPGENRNGTVMRKSNITDTVYMSTLEINKMTSDKVGNLKFVLQTNGSIVQRVFHLTSIRVVEQDIEKVIADHFHTDLLVGTVYELLMWHIGPVAMNNISIDVFVQKPGQNCKYVQLTLEEMFYGCGIKAVTIIGENDTTLNNRSGMRIVIKATNSCMIIGNLQSTNFGGSMTSLNITVIDSDTYEYPISQTFSMVASAHQSPCTQTQVIRSNVTLSCIVPICDWHFITWCKEGTTHCLYAQRESGVTFGGNLDAYDTSIHAAFRNVSRYSGSFEISITNLQASHSGIYKCYVSKHSSLRRDLEMRTRGSRLSRNSSCLLVKDPLGPRFLSGEANYTYKAWLDETKERSLLCNVEGNPKPDIIWFRKKGNSNDVIAQDNQHYHVHEPGIYECRAINIYGRNSRKFVVADANAATTTISTTPIAISIPAAVAMIILSVGIVIWKKQRARAALFNELDNWLNANSAIHSAINPDQPLNEQAEKLRIKKEFEIHPDDFIINKSEMLGEGEFSIVYKGDYERNGRTQKVAIKIPRDDTNGDHWRSLFVELKIMAHIEPHPNVLALVGHYTIDIKQGQLVLLTEFCEYGSLKTYLEKHWDEFDPNDDHDNRAGPSRNEKKNELWCYAYQAANGMNHLSSESRIVHRDLALRNLLLAAGHVVKISDFGMSRCHQINFNELAYKSTDSKVPLKWMALECLVVPHQYVPYTEKSDVWSFGIVLWEIFSCNTPYAAEQLYTQPALVEWLLENRLTKPQTASDKMYSLMTDCWNKNPNNRPSFSQCKRKIAEELEEISRPALKRVKGTIGQAWQKTRLMRGCNGVRDEQPAQEPEMKLRRRVFNQIQKPQASDQQPKELATGNQAVDPPLADQLASDTNDFVLSSRTEANCLRVPTDYTELDLNNAHNCVTMAEIHVENYPHSQSEPGNSTSCF